MLRREQQAADREQPLALGVERSTNTAEAQRIAMDELPWIPIYTMPTTVWLGSRITGVAPSIVSLLIETRSPGAQSCS